MNKQTKQAIGEVGGAQAGIQVSGQISLWFSYCGKVEDGKWVSFFLF